MNVIRDCDMDDKSFIVTVQFYPIVYLFRFGVDAELAIKFTS